MHDHLHGLNEPQKTAVLHTDGPLLIIAGAGAGKTRTLTHRILNLIKTGVAPEKILAITFTNKAAKEMRERVTKLLETDMALNRPVSSVGVPFLSTFHSLGVHILRAEAHTLGLTKTFTILDRGDAIRLIKDSMRELDLDPKSFEPGKLLSIISREKGNMVTADTYAERQQNSYTGKIIADVWQKYERLKSEDKALDFDDLLQKTALLFRANEEIREKYQHRWSHIHIDEYQDTNEAQYEIAKVLAKKHRNIAVVGDIDQNIYSWRGASIKNILDFEKDYPDATVVLLEENYRSTQTILTVANRIIEKNKERRKKVLFTKNAEGEKVSLYEGYDENDEARFIASKAKELIGNGVAPREIAVLYRANFQGRALEEAFLNHDLPYQVLGVKFFERKEIKDVICYLKTAVSGERGADFKRVLNTPPRGLGKVAMVKILRGNENELPAKAKSQFDSFIQLLGRIKAKTQTESLSQVLKFIIEESGLKAELRRTEEDVERLENMKELVTFATRYDTREKQEAIEAFLTDAALQSDQDELKEERNAVRLMTVHASKGLEFDYIFVSGMEQDLFPHSRFDRDGDADDASREEERRLFYVALTRARKKIYLSYTSIRTIFGASQVNVPSEFIFDIDEEFIEKEERFEGSSGKIVYLD